MTKRVYLFGGNVTEGTADMKNLLGGKGANLAEMARIGIPVPAGFTITTEVCNEYYKNNQKLPESLKEEVATALHEVEGIMGAKFGDHSNPLLVSVRSGARASMPGMMDTILNLGINEDVIKGLVKKTKNERFAWDSYRRFIQMYGDVVLGLKPGNKDEHDPFEVIMDELKEKRKVKNDLDLTIDDLKELVTRFKKLIQEKLKVTFPDDPLSNFGEL